MSTTDELVARLRAPTLIYNRGPDYEPLKIPPSRQDREAADAIETLTRERDEARAVIENAHVGVAVSAHKAALAEKDARITKMEADKARLQEALATARAWHESEDKALSKSGRSDVDYHWRRGGHEDQIADIRQVLPDEEYNATLDRINARAALEATR